MPILDTTALRRDERNVILVHTALMCEARPLLSQFRLKTVPLDGSLRLFRNDEMAVVVSGVGRARAAAAVSFAFERLRNASGARAFLLNLGVCGSAHPEKSLGQPFLIHKCTEVSSGRSFFPDILFSHALPEASLHTVDRVVYSKGDVNSDQFSGCELVDMEAAGFLEAASLFVPPSHAMSVKVVGDFLEDARQVTPDVIDSRMKSALPLICDFIQDYRAFAARSDRPRIDENDARTIRHIEESLQLTQSQRDQLHNAVRFFRLSGRKGLLDAVRPFLTQTPRHKRDRASLFGDLLQSIHGE